LFEILISIGVLFILIALWRGKVQSAARERELNELKQVRKQLTEAKQEVNALLEQLEIVSERVVEDITAKVEEVKTVKAELNNQTTRVIQATEVIPTDIIEKEEVKTEVQPKNNTIIFPKIKKDSYKNHCKIPDIEYPPNEAPSKQLMIFALAQLGYSPDDIAQHLKMGKGEVKLMLQLKLKGDEANG
jgi:hypothetical protein